MRGIGWFVSAVLLLLCAALIVCSVLFGSDGIVKAFGYNIYLSKTGEFENVPLGSAVLAKHCSPYDLETDNLILYQTDEGTFLAYADDIRMEDGSYIIRISDSNSVSEINGSQLLGKAEYCSAFLGSFISFSMTPLGIIVIAVIPCLVLVALDIIRAVAAKLPPPEVEPQFKTTDEAPEPSSNLSVKPDGNAAYSRTGPVKPAETADEVLFSYTARQKPAPARSPIIPLTDRSDNKPAPAKPASTKPTPKPAAEAAAKSDPVKPAPKPSEKPASTKPAPEIGKTPASVAARNYVDSVVSAPKVSGDTAELPVITKKSRSDAFFTQSEAPQIGRQKPANRSVIDLEDALATAGKRSAGKRSSEILAGKNPSELISDDDEKSDRGRYAVDDILAGLDKKV
ncbi:MAG: hypothetical protein ACI4Q4_07035 [Oscillospiraceae bacterium]